MRRSNALFALLVVLSAVVGATAAADFGTAVDTVGNVVPAVQEQVTTDVEAVRLVDGSLRIAVRLDNPTGYDVELTGAFFRLFNASEAQIAGGPAIRLDDGRTILPAKGGLAASYEVPLTPDEERRVATALDRDDTELTGRFGAVLNDEQFTIRIEPRGVSGSGES